MAGAKLSPRQRMINMMYLVLTALLALNVSKEIINAFVTVNDSLEVSNKNTTDKNKLTYEAFDFAMKNDQTKTKPFFDKAMATKKLSDQMSGYIDSLKKALQIKTDKIKTEEGQKVPPLIEMSDKENYDVPTKMLCGSENDGKGFEASKLKAKIVQFKQDLAKNVAPEEQKKFIARFDDLLNTKDPDPNSVVFKEDKKRTWEMANFYHNPVVASVALLTKFQSDVKNAESEVINNLFSSINAKSYKFEKLQARVIAPTSYVLLGQKYSADVFLAAYSATANPKIMVGDVDTAKRVLRGNGTEVPVSGGLGKYEASASSEGIKKWGGIITVKNPETNLEESYPFEASYVAAKPSTVISADKMNVLYIGVDNPMSISVPGVANDLVSVTASGGGVSLAKDSKLGGGHYVATATTQGECTISVSAKLDNKNMPMGLMKYRVKRVPDPVAKIANMKGGPINKNTLAAQSAIIPVMEGFDFELFPRITGFKITVVKRGKDPVEMDSNSNLLTQAMKDQILSAPLGTKIYFEYIKATLPDKTTRSLNPLNFVLN
ncbi:MAG: gliding motility protein GldM [Bacteroidia bacterium]